MMTNIILMGLGMGALLTLFLPFSPMTIDVVNLKRETVLWIYRNRKVFWAVAILALGGLLLRSGLQTWGAGPAVPGAATWFWATLGCVAVMAMMFWTGYVPFVMTPPRAGQILTADEADKALKPDSSVLGLVRDGEARAYPRDLIARPHYLNDKVGGTALTVSYCILCNSGIAMKSEIGGKPMSLHSVTAYNNNIIYRDPERDNYIQQLDGEIIAGPDAGKTVETLPLLMTTWDDWKRLHPDTTVYFSPPRTLRDKMVNRMLMMMIPIEKLARRTAPWHRIRGTLDPRLPAMSLVLGVEHNGARCAYPIDRTAKAQVIDDTLGGDPVAVFHDPAHSLASVYDRRVDGTVLTFTPVTGRTDGVVAQDSATGSLWSIHGAACEGPYKDQQLRELPHFNKLFWFSWALFRPGTRVYGADAKGQDKDTAAEAPAGT